MRDQATHRTEHTGNPVIDRLQGVVRDLVARMRDVVLDLALLGLGSIDIAMGDRDRELTVTEASNVHINLIDAHTAVHVLKVPNAPRKGRSYVRWISNNITSGHAVTVSTPKGGSTNLNAGTTRAFIVKHDTIATLT